jgi:hypothetical protein
MGSVKTRGKRQARRGARGQTPRMQTAQEQLGEVTGKARERVMARLDVQRDVLVSALEDVARGLESATRRTSSRLSRRALEAGGSALRSVSSRLDETSVDELLGRTGQFLVQRPAWLITGLLGTGLLAGRVFRASGMGELEGAS